MLSAISADEYKHNKQTLELDSASRTFWSRKFENWCKRFSESLWKRIKERYKYVIKHRQFFLGYSP